MRAKGLTDVGIFLHVVKKRRAHCLAVDASLQLGYFAGRIHLD